MGFYGRRMVPEPLLKLLKKLDDAGVTDEDLAALAGLAEELGDKASLTEDNTFTGDNYFEGVVEFGGDNSEVTFDGDKVYESDTGETFNSLMNAKQNKLYHHKIAIGFTYNSKNGKVNIDLYCTKSTSMTKEDVYNYITNNGNNSVNELNCNGIYDDNILTYISFTDGVDTTDANWDFIEELGIIYIEDGAITTDTITGIYSNNVQYVYDSVIEIS